MKTNNGGCIFKVFPRNVILKSVLKKQPWAAIGSPQLSPSYIPSPVQQLQHGRPSASAYNTRTRHCPSRISTVIESFRDTRHTGVIHMRLNSNERLPSVRPQRTVPLVGACALSRRRRWSYMPQTRSAAGVVEEGEGAEKEMFVNIFVSKP